MTSNWSQQNSLFHNLDEQADNSLKKVDYV